MVWHRGRKRRGLLDAVRIGLEGVNRSWIERGDPARRRREDDLVSLVEEHVVRVSALGKVPPGWLSVQELVSAGEDEENLAQPG